MRHYTARGRADHDSIFLDFLDVFGWVLCKETFTKPEEMHSSAVVVNARRVAFDTTEEGMAVANSNASPPDCNSSRESYR